MKPSNDIADHLKRVAEQEETLEKQISTLYRLRCFEVMLHDSGAPLAMRVPGGWIFYTASGGGGLSMAVGDEEGDEDTILGHVAPSVSGVFVPFNNEFMRKNS